MALLAVAGVLVLLAAMFTFQQTGPLGLCGNLLDAGKISNEANDSDSFGAQSVVEECKPYWARMGLLAFGAGSGAVIGGVFGVLLVVGVLPPKRRVGAPAIAAGP